MGFYDEVYRLCKEIPKGKISTYGAIGDKLKTKAYRAVGQALKNNPDAPRTPCHRVVNSKGFLHGFGGETKGKKIKDKENLLLKEGVKVKDNKVLNFKEKLFRF